MPLCTVSFRLWLLTFKITNNATSLKQLRAWVRIELPSRTHPLTPAATGIPRRWDVLYVPTQPSHPHPHKRDIYFPCTQTPPPHRFFFYYYYFRVWLFCARCNPTKVRICPPHPPHTPTSVFRSARQVSCSDRPRGPGWTAWTARMPPNAPGIPTSAATSRVLLHPVNLLPRPRPPPFAHNHVPRSTCPFFYFQIRLWLLPPKIVTFVCPSGSEWVLPSWLALRFWFWPPSALLSAAGSLCFVFRTGFDPASCESLDPALAFPFRSVAICGASELVGLRRDVRHRGFDLSTSRRGDGVLRLPPCPGNFVAGRQLEDPDPEGLGAFREVAELVKWMNEFEWGLFEKSRSRISGKEIQPVSWNIEKIKVWQNVNNANVDFWSIYKSPRSHTQQLEGDFAVNSLKVIIKTKQAMLKINNIWQTSLRTKTTSKQTNQQQAEANNRYRNVT